MNREIWLPDLHRLTCGGQFRPFYTMDRIKCQSCQVVLIEDWTRKHQFGPVQWVVDTFLVKEWP